MAYLNIGDVQLVYIQRHGEVGQIIDGTQHLVGLGDFTGVVVFVHDGAGDGSGDGVVVQLLGLLVVGELGVAQALRGALDLVAEVIAGHGEDGLVLVDPVSLGDGDGGNGAGHIGHHRGLVLVGKGAAGAAAYPVHGGGGALGGGDAAGIGHLDGDLTDDHVAGEDLGVGGDLTDGAGEGLKGGVQGDRSGLPNVEVLGLVGGEGDSELHHVGVADGGHRLPGTDLVTHLHVQGEDTAGNRGGYGEVLQTLHGIVVVALSLIHRDLRLLQRTGGVRGVDGVENGTLLHLVAFFEIGGEDGVLQQGCDRVGVRRLQGAAAGDGGGDGLPRYLGGGVGGVGRGGGVLVAAQEVPGAAAGDGTDQHQGHQLLDPALPAPLFLYSDSAGVVPGGVGGFLQIQYHASSRPFRVVMRKLFSTPTIVREEPQH